MSRSKKIIIFITILFLLPIVGIVLAFWGWVYIQTSTIGQKLLYPPRQYSTQVADFVSPRGWEVEIERKYSLEKGGGFAHMSSLMHGIEREFKRTALISFSFQKGSDEKRLYQTLFGRFLQDVNALRSVVSIGDKEVVFYRYEGPLYFDPNKEQHYIIRKNDKHHNVTIGFFCDSGFYGIFWGLNEQEKDFWRVMKSIKWNT